MQSTENTYLDIQESYQISYKAKNRLTDFFRERWEFIDVFTGVLAAGHAEAELKVKTLEQLLSEIMSLDHPEVFNRHFSNCELNAGGSKTYRQTYRRTDRQRKGE